MYNITTVTGRYTRTHTHIHKKGYSKVTTMRIKVTWVDLLRK